jgi:glycosyltransferase involved in cell wall biosynthesis
MDGPKTVTPRRIQMIAHPTCLLDEFAGPFVHISGTRSGLEALGYDVSLSSYATLERFLSSSRGRPSRSLLTCLSRMALPFAALASCLGHRGALPYIRHYYDFIITYLLLRLLARPFVVEVNSTLFEEPHVFERFPRPLLRLARMVEYTGLRGATAIVTVSEVLRSRLVERGCDRAKVLVAHNGCDCRELDRRDHSDVAGTGFLFVGNFKRWHGIDSLLRAYAMMGEAERLELTLVGGAIESVLDQTYRDLEVVVVDDGSTDGSPAVVCGYLSDGRVKLVRHDVNRGIPATRNTGIASSAGEFVRLLPRPRRFVGA